MASSPKYKVYLDDEYIASVKDLSDGAVLVSVHGRGTVRLDHDLILWDEGHEGFSAGDSYDQAAVVMQEREQSAQAFHFSRRYTKRPTARETAAVIKTAHPARLR